MSSFSNIVLFRNTSVTTRFMVSAAFSIVLLFVSFGALYNWNQSDWVTLINGGKPLFTTKDLIYATIATLALPTGVFLFLHSISTLLTYFIKNLVIFTLIVVALICSALSGIYLLYSWAGHYWLKTHCVFFYCFHSQDSRIEPILNDSAQGLGFKATLVFPAMTLLILLILVFLGVLISKWKALCSQPKISQNAYLSYTDDLIQCNYEDFNINNHASTNKNGVNKDQLQFPTPPSPSSSSPILKNKLFILISLLTVLLACYLVASIIPGQFRQLSPERIANKSLIFTTNNHTQCKEDGQKFTCPEYQSAFFQSQSVAISDYIVLKLYASNNIYYLGVIILLLVVILGNWVMAIKFGEKKQSFLKKVQNFLNYKVRIPQNDLFFLCRRQTKEQLNKAQVVENENSLTTNQADEPMNKQQHSKKNDKSYLQELLLSSSLSDHVSEDSPYSQNGSNEPNHENNNEITSPHLPSSKSTKKLYNKYDFAYWSVGEVIFVLLLTIVSFSFFYYWLVDHDFKGYWLKNASHSHISNRLMRSSGHLGTFFFSLLLFPAARTSPLLQLFGISFENSIKYHRISGMLFMGIVFLHMIAAYWVYLVNSDYNWSAMFKDIIIFPQQVMRPKDDWTIFVIQLLTWMSFITIGIFARDTFRRKNYSFFVIMHYLTYLTITPAILLHASNAWQYLLPALSIFVVDRLIRFYRGLLSGANSLVYIPHTYIKVCSTVTDMPHHGNSDETPDNEENKVQVETQDHSLFTPTSGIKIIDHGLAGQFTELKINLNADHFALPKPGQYYFLNIAELSLYEYHPITIANAPSITSSIYNGQKGQNEHENRDKNMDDIGKPFAKSIELVFLIKSMGKNTWSGGLYDYIKEHIDLTLNQHQINNSKSEINQLENNLEESNPKDPVAVEVPLTITLDGPYGEYIDYEQYDNVILVGGGVGITPIKSIYENFLSKAQLVEKAISAPEFARKLQSFQTNLTLLDSNLSSMLPPTSSRCSCCSTHSCCRYSDPMNTVLLFEDDQFANSSRKDVLNNHNQSINNKSNNLNLNDQKHVNNQDINRNDRGHNSILNHDDVDQVVEEMKKSFNIPKVPKNVHMVFSARDLSLYNIMNDSLVQTIEYQQKNSQNKNENNKMNHQSSNQQQQPQQQLYQSSFISFHNDLTSLSHNLLSYFPKPKFSVDLLLSKLYWKELESSTSQQYSASNSTLCELETSSQSPSPSINFNSCPSPTSSPTNQFPSITPQSSPTINPPYTTKQTPNPDDPKSNNLLKQQRDKMTKSIIFDHFVRNPVDYEQSRPGVCVLTQMLDQFFVKTNIDRTPTASNLNDQNVASGLSSSYTIKTIQPTGKTLLFVCGPSGMVQRCQDYAFKNNFDVHAEVFEF